MSSSLFGIKYNPKCVESFNKENITVEDPPRPTQLAQMLLKSYIEPLKLLLNKCFEDKQYLFDQQSFLELSDYQKGTSEILKNKVEDLSRIVLGTSATLWSEVFYPVFHRKCEQVAVSKIDLIFEFLRADAFPKFKKYGLKLRNYILQFKLALDYEFSCNLCTFFPVCRLDDDFNLVEYIWKASVVKGVNANSPTIFSSNRDVDLKLKCISPHVAEISGEIEQGFSEFLKDFNSLGDFSLKKYISSNILEKWNKFLEDQTQSPCLFLGRLLSSLPELCPTIWKLLDMKDGTELRSALTSVSEKCWAEWSKQVVEKFKANLGSKMDKLENHSVAIFMPVAEVHIPEGEDAITPSVRVPLQISHLLHSSLFSLCNDLSRVGPQSIPKRVKEDLRLDIGSTIISLYKDLVDRGKSDVSPQTALQLIFDIKFCQWFHLQLKDQADPLAKILQGVIDPFDMDIVAPKIKTNLKRFLFETHVSWIIGSIILKTN